MSISYRSGTVLVLGMIVGMDLEPPPPPRGGILEQETDQGGYLLIHHDQCKGSVGTHRRGA